MNRKPRIRKKIGSPLLVPEDFPLEDEQSKTVTGDFESVIATLQIVFQNCSDFVTKQLTLADDLHVRLFYLESMVDGELLDQQVVTRLQSSGETEQSAPTSETDRLHQLKQMVLNIASTKTATTLTDITKHILNGHVAVYISRFESCLIVPMVNSISRSIEEPSGESYIRGPRAGFTEDIMTNTMLIRRLVRTNRLKVETFTIGELSQTKIELMYIEGLASPSILAEVKSRIAKIEVDGIFESGNLEEWIEDHSYTPFPQIQNTERPDVVAANLIEGRFAILLNGTPFVLMLPYTFWSGMQSGEDYYERFIISTLIRWVRYFFLFIALLLPSLYVAITTFHQEMMPTNLLLSISEAREASPFPALVEALIMEITFEALREAGVRLPKQVGSAISIVGALVIGQAAVQAGIVSAPMVIVVSITAIASFTIPRFNMGISIRILRFPMILLAGTFGLYGITVGLIGMLMHLTSLRSFGVPYFTPVAPFSTRGLKDVFIRLPNWQMNKKPQAMLNETIPPSTQDQGGE